MAAFFGTMKGNRGVATRCGSAESGIQVSAQSWFGSLIVDMHVDPYRHKDAPPVVQLYKAEGSESKNGTLLFEGTLEELEKKLTN